MHSANKYIQNNIDINSKEPYNIRIKSIMYTLEELKMKIESMSKQHHIEILKILKKTNTVTLNENKSGVYVNISFLPIQTIESIGEYVKYIEEQEATLSSLEIQKQDCKNTFFIEKGNKEETLLYSK